MGRLIRKHSTLIFLIFMSLLMIQTTVFAWVVYVDQKAVAQFNAGEISITTVANGQLILDDLQISELAFIDYEKDFILNQSGSLDAMAATIRVQIFLDMDSVPVRNRIHLIPNDVQNGLLYVVVVDGINVAPEDRITEYHVFIANVIAGHATKEAQLAAIDAYNQTVLDAIYDLVLKPGENLYFQIVFWGDYDELEHPDQFMDQIYTFTFMINSVNSKGEVD